MINIYDIYNIYIIYIYYMSVICIYKHTDYNYRGMKYYTCVYLKHKAMNNVFKYLGLYLNFKNVFIKLCLIQSTFDIDPDEVITLI